MKYKIIVLVLFSPLFFHVQGQPCRIQSIEIEKYRKYLVTAYKNNQLVYSGLFGTSYWLPMGTHCVYDDEGEIRRVTEYSFSDEHFEGVPIVVEKSYVFNNKGQLEKIMQGEWCNECEFKPTGVWEYYKKGQLIKTVNTQKRPQSDLFVEYTEDKYTGYYWKLEQDCK